MATFAVGNKKYPKEKFHMFFKVWSKLCYIKCNSSYELMAKEMKVTTDICKKWVSGSTFSYAMSVRHKMRAILGDSIFAGCAENLMQYLDDGKPAGEAVDEVIEEYSCHKYFHYEGKTFNQVFTDTLEE